jgi:hypothetical protein
MQMLLCGGSRFPDGHLELRLLWQELEKKGFNLCKKYLGVLKRTGLYTLPADVVDMVCY